MDNLTIDLSEILKDTPWIAVTVFLLWRYGEKMDGIKEALEAQTKTLIELAAEIRIIGRERQ